MLTAPSPASMAACRYRRSAWPPRVSSSRAARPSEIARSRTSRRFAANLEDDLDVTNKKSRGNVTQSYRTRHPMRIIGEVEHWERHPPQILQSMLNSIAKLRADGHDVTEE